MGQIAASDIDKRFSLLNLALSNRTRAPIYQPPFTAKPDALSNYVPPTQSAPLGLQTSQHDPHVLLRALAKTDADRPPVQIRDAVRRAVKDVQRVHEAGDEAVTERRLTDVPPPTPRISASSHHN